MPDQLKYEGEHFEVIYDGKIRKCWKCQREYHSGQVCLEMRHTEADVETGTESANENNTETADESNLDADDEGNEEGFVTPPTEDGSVRTPNI